MLTVIYSLLLPATQLNLTLVSDIQTLLGYFSCLWDIIAQPIVYLLFWHFLPHPLESFAYCVYICICISVYFRYMFKSMHLCFVTLNYTCCCDSRKIDCLLCNAQCIDVLNLCLTVSCQILEFSQAGKGILKSY